MQELKNGEARHSRNAIILFMKEEKNQTFKEIGDFLGVSENIASELYKKAVFESESQNKSITVSFKKEQSIEYKLGEIKLKIQKLISENHFSSAIPQLTKLVKDSKNNTEVIKFAFEQTYILENKVLFNSMLTESRLRYYSDDSAYTKQSLTNALNHLLNNPKMLGYKQILLNSPIFLKIIKLEDFNETDIIKIAYDISSTDFNKFNKCYKIDKLVSENTFNKYRLANLITNGKWLDIFNFTKNKNILITDDLKLLCPDQNKIELINMSINVIDTYKNAKKTKLII